MTDTYLLFAAMLALTPLDTLLFVTIVYSPSLVRWTVSAICLPRIILKITPLRITIFFLINIVTQIFIAHFVNTNDINAATEAVAIAEGVISLGWIAAAAVRRRRL